ncbi:luciferin sulfotransferase-like [Culicoides brevitarsis]|uniref:luciferin sulfotransferase-like n=1 Tax=Culicoides brevitarsis TaxID=469753 RepID=UPI00307B7C17
MLEFEPVGPVKIDCFGANTHIYVSINRSNNNDELGEKREIPKKMVILEKYRKMAPRIKEMEVYDDDVWVVSFPKCGTTWTQEMVWLLNNNLNFVEAKKVNLLQRFPFLELSGVLSQIPDGSEDVIFNAPRPRHIKSHLNVDLLPDKIWSSQAKIIYVARNPKDAAISFFHHYRNLVGYPGTKEDFLDAYMEGKIIYAPFFDHLLGFWDIRKRENVLFLTYEDMKRDIMGALRKTSDFLGKSYTEEQLMQAADHLSLKNMRNNPACNNDELVREARKFNKMSSETEYKFIRKGETKAFEQEMSDEYKAKFDKWIAESLKGTDFPFKY